MLTCDITEGYSYITEVWDEVGHEKISINIVCNINVLPSWDWLLHTVPSNISSPILRINSKTSSLWCFRAPSLALVGTSPGSRWRSVPRGMWRASENCWRNWKRFKDFFFYEKRKKNAVVSFNLFFYILAPEACAFWKFYHEHTWCQTFLSFL